jgi:Fur family ferric uptake transcriptional regulator
MVASGLIRKIESDGGQRRFDGDLADHYHVRCLYCGKVEDAPLPMLSRLNQTFGKMSEYTILRHRLEFLGICPGCQQAVARKN